MCREPGIPSARLQTPLTTGLVQGLLPRTFKLSSAVPMILRPAFRLNLQRVKLTLLKYINAKGRRGLKSPFNRGEHGSPAFSAPPVSLPPLRKPRPRAKRPADGARFRAAPSHAENSRETCPAGCGTPPHSPFRRKTSPFHFPAIYAILYCKSIHPGERRPVPWPCRNPPNS